MSDEVRFRRATVADAGEILTLQRAAFVQEARRYAEPELVPLVETLGSVVAAIDSAIVVVGCMAGGRVVATGRVLTRDGVGHVARLAVAPDLQGRGIGRLLLAELERRCGPDVGAFELFTGGRSDANLHLYRSTGYRDTWVEEVGPDVTLVHLRKERDRAPAAQDGEAPNDRPAGLVADQLVGTWLLESWEAVGDDGSVATPFGEQPEGMLVYGRDGTMLTTIAPAGRPRLSSADPLRGGPDDERRRTAETFVAYGGTWHVTGADVVHAVTTSLYPNWVGTSQRRHVRIDADGTRLELSTDPFELAGRRATQRLAWRRGP